MVGAWWGAWWAHGGVHDVGAWWAHPREKHRKYDFKEVVHEIMCFFVLYCNVLYCILLFFFCFLFCIVLYCIVLY